MGILNSIVGHDAIRDSLLNAWSQDRLPSQLLFVGPEGVGKKLFAWGMAELLLCERANEKGQACGLCHSCLKVRSHCHENVLYIEPEKNLIKLDRAKEIQEYLSLAQDRGPRLVIVDGAHALNAQASNSLLKIFEEPPPQTYFIFVTSRWTQVLPTIRSRSTRIAFAPLKNQQLNRWVDGHPEWLVWARGSVGELLKQRSEDEQSFKKESSSLLERLLFENDFFILGDWRDQLKDKERLLSFSRFSLIAIHQAMLNRFSITRTPLQNGDRAPQGGSVALHGLTGPLFDGFKLLPDEKLWLLWERGLNIEQGVLGNRDPVLLVEEWLIPVLMEASESGTIGF